KPRTTPLWVVGILLRWVGGRLSPSRSASSFASPGRRLASPIRRASSLFRTRLACRGSPDDVVTSPIRLLISPRVPARKGRCRGPGIGFSSSGGFALRRARAVPGAWQLLRFVRRVAFQGRTVVRLSAVTLDDIRVQAQVRRHLFDQDVVHEIRQVGSVPRPYL